MANLSQRFLAKFQEVPEIGCWIWTACVDKDGYGQVTINSRSYRAHRVSYESRFGAIPDGLVIDHLCRQPSCVNPDHLRAVTNRENLMAEGSLAPAKRQAEQTHCKRCGSELVQLSDQRGCLPCRREGWRRQNHRRAQLLRAKKATAVLSES